MEGLFDVPQPKHCADGCWYCQADRPKEAGQLAAITSVSPQWYDAAEAWIMRQPKGTRFTSEQMTQAIGKPSATGQHANNAVGAFISGQSRLKRIKPIGYVPSQNRESHGHVIREWVKL